MGEVVRPLRRAAGALLVGVLSCAVAGAQTPHWTLSLPDPIRPTSVAMSASGHFVALLTSTTLLPEDDRAYGADLYVYDVESAAWSWVPNAVLYPHISHELVLVGLSDDGRYVGYAAVLGGEHPYLGLWRYDRATGTVETVVDFADAGSGASAGTHVAMSRDGWTFAWMQRHFNPTIIDPLFLTVRRVGETTYFGTHPCFDRPGSTAPSCTFVPVLSADGRHVTYRAGGYYEHPGLSTAAVDRSSHVERHDVLPFDAIGPLAASGDVNFVVLPAASGSRGVLDTRTGILDPLPVPGAPIIPIGITDDGSLVLARRMDGGGSASVLYSVRVTAYPTDGAPLVHEAVVTDGRLTVWVAAVFPALDGQRFSAIVEALEGAAGRPQLVVEKAIYGGGLRSGVSASATPVLP